jgi:hypothetical protein
VPSSVGIKEVSHSIKNGWIAHYRCMQYRASTDKKRSRESCKAWIKIRDFDGVVVLTSVENHENCEEAVKRSRITDIALPVVNGVMIGIFHLFLLEMMRMS